MDPNKLVIGNKYTLKCLRRREGWGPSTAELLNGGTYIFRFLGDGRYQFEFTDDTRRREWGMNVFTVNRTDISEIVFPLSCAAGRRL